MKIFLCFFLFCGSLVAAPTVSLVKGNENLSVQRVGNDEILGSFLVVNPSPYASFRLQFNFVNGCNFGRFGGGTGLPLTGVSIRDLDADTLMYTWSRSGDDCNVFVLDLPVAVQTKSIEVLGSWSSALAGSVLAGRLWEAITITPMD